MFDEEDFLQQEAEVGRDASVTPTASPRRKSNGLSRPPKPITIKPTSPKAPSTAEAKLMSIVGAHLPSHRGSWSAAGLLEEVASTKSKQELPDVTLEEEDGDQLDSTEGMHDRF